MHFILSQFVKCCIKWVAYERHNTLTMHRWLESKAHRIRSDLSWIALALVLSIQPALYRQVLKIFSDADGDIHRVPLWLRTWHQQPMISQHSQSCIHFYTDISLPLTCLWCRCCQDLLFSISLSWTHYFQSSNIFQSCKDPNFLQINFNSYPRVPILSKIFRRSIISLSNHISTTFSLSNHAICNSRSNQLFHLQKCLPMNA